MDASTAAVRVRYAGDDQLSIPARNHELAADQPLEGGGWPIHNTLRGALRLHKSGTIDRLPQRDGYLA